MPVTIEVRTHRTFVHRCNGAVGSMYSSLMFGNETHIDWKEYARFCKLCGERLPRTVEEAEKPAILALEREQALRAALESALEDLEYRGDTGRVHAIGTITDALAATPATLELEPQQLVSIADQEINHDNKEVPK